MLTKRLSKNFMLIDFMYDLDSYTNSGLVYSRLTKDAGRVIEQGKSFCTEFLDVLVEKYGAVSVAAGFCYDCVGAHLWNDEVGCAADVVFHDWVNKDKPPVQLLWEIDQSSMLYERLIGYAGTEFSCIAYKPRGGNRSAFYDNIRNPDKPLEKPFFKNLGVGAGKRAARKGVPLTNRSDWRRKKNEPVYHTKRQIRPQHFRVGEYFTFLDMCKNHYAFSRGVGTVPPARIIKHSNYLYVARMFAEVLDPVVKEQGMLSIVRGLEPSNINLEQNTYHQWLNTHDEHHIIIAVHKDYGDIFLDHPSVLSVKKKEDEESTYYKIAIEPFDPINKWVSYSE